jgi:hypothetical protein
MQERNDLPLGSLILVPGIVRAVGIPLLALLLLPVSVVATMKIEFPYRIAVFGVGSIVALLVAFRGWPALARTLFAYGLAARLPVALIMLVAIFGNWGTHYELGAPGFPEMAPLPKWLWIGLLPQMTFWMAFTVVVGALAGGLTALVAGRREPAKTSAVSPAR